MEEAAKGNHSAHLLFKEKQTLLFFLIDSLVNWLKRYYNSISRQSGIVHKDKSEKLKVLNEWICEQWLIGGCRWPSAKPTIQSNLLFLMGRLVELGLLRPCGPRKQMKSIENWLVLFYWWGGRNLKIFDFQWRGPRSSTNQLFLLSLIKQSKDICFIDGGEESCWRAALPFLHKKIN